MNTSKLAPELLHKIDAYWCAANYVSAGQIYLYDNPLLKRPLTLADVKHMLLGHWGTTPGQNFIYVHLKPDHQEIRPRHDLRFRSRTRGPRRRGQRVSRRHTRLDTTDKLSDDDRKTFIETARKALEEFSAKPDSKSEPELETENQPTLKPKTAPVKNS